MATEQISVRLKTLKTIKAVAKELDRSISAVIDASIDDDKNPGQTKNAAVVEALARIGKKMAPPEALEGKAGEKGVFFYYEELLQEQTLGYIEKYYVTEADGYRLWLGIRGRPYADYGYQIYRRVYRDDQPESKGAAKS